MRTAIISDLHANIAATQAVFKHIDSLGDVTRLICLGDAIGYGPNPLEVLEIVMERCDVCLMGNHEEAVLSGAVNFNPKARIAIDWTRNVVVANSDESKEQNETRQQYLESMPEFLTENNFMYTHGSPIQYCRDYVLPRDAFNKHKIQDIFERMGECQFCFVGHSHQPGVFTSNGYYHPSEMKDSFEFCNGDKLIVNVGSVGQPRDGNTMACYATMNAKSIVWHRVAYDLEDTKRRIYEIPELDNSLGDRLLEGR